MPKKKPHYYDFERRKGRIVSAILHGLYLLLAIFGLPSLLMPRAPEEPTAISVEILPITGVTNVRPSDQPLAQEAKQEAHKAEQKKSSPETKVAQAVPAPEPLPNVKIKDKPQPLPKKEEQKPEPKKEDKPKPKDDPFKHLLNDLKNSTQKQKKEAAEKAIAPAPAAKSTQYNPTLPMSMSETDAIMSQIAKNWRLEAGAKDAQNLVPLLNAEYNSDGSLVSVVPADSIKDRYESDLAFRSAVESAIRAVKITGPLKGLPAEKYDSWHYMELRFDPKFMLN